MAISRVQSASALSAGSTTSLAVTMGSTPTNGNFMVAIIATNGGTTGRVSSIAQTGATWVKAVDVASASCTVDIWYAENISSAGTGVTINYVASLLNNAIVLEYSGIATSSSLDVTASNTGTYPGTADSGTTATTAQANELWIAGLDDVQFPSGTWNAPSNSFTEIVEAANIFLNLVGEEKIVSATGTANTSAGRGSAPLSGNWAGAIATFKEAAAPTRRIFVV